MSDLANNPHVLALPYSVRMRVLDAIRGVAEEGAPVAEPMVSLSAVLLVIEDRRLYYAYADRMSARDYEGQRCCNELKSQVAALAAAGGEDDE